MKDYENEHKGASFPPLNSEFPTHKRATSQFFCQKPDFFLKDIFFVKKK